VTESFEDGLLRLVSEVLSVPQDKITAEDNIFELGAHSIQLATLLARIESDLGQKIRIEALWDNQTVARLAAHVAAQAAADAPANA